MIQLLNKDQDERLGCTCGSCQYHSAANIKQHNFFSKVLVHTVYEMKGPGEWEEDGDWGCGLEGGEKRKENDSN